jgi:hypothetical protein
MEERKSHHLLLDMVIKKKLSALLTNTHNSKKMISVILVLRGVSSNLNIYREYFKPTFEAFKGLLPIPEEDLFWLKIIDTAKSKIYCRNTDGCIDGYGLVLI